MQKMKDEKKNNSPQFLRVVFALLSLLGVLYWFWRSPIRDDTPIINEISETGEPPLLSVMPSLTPENSFIPITRQADKTDMVMVYVPEGVFEMGSEEGDIHESPAHSVYLDAFWIDQTEVTNRQFAEYITAIEIEVKAQQLQTVTAKTVTELMGASVGPGGMEFGLFWENPTGINSSWETIPTHPVVRVSWYDANMFCQWRGARLPTEAEWEKAARGIDQRTYPWGEVWDANKLNFCDKNCELAEIKQQRFDDGFWRTSPVGSYEGGRSPYGLYDMAGNVSEWVNDWYDPDYYEKMVGEISVNPQGSEDGMVRWDGALGPTKVIRGGSFADRADLTRSFSRNKDFPRAGFYATGFRCAQTLSEGKP